LRALPAQGMVPAPKPIGLAVRRTTWVPPPVTRGGLTSSTIPCEMRSPPSTDPHAHDLKAEGVASLEGPNRQDRGINGEPDGKPECQLGRGGERHPVEVDTRTFRIWRPAGVTVQRSLSVTGDIATTASQMSAPGGILMIVLLLVTSNVPSEPMIFVLPQPDRPTQRLGRRDAETLPLGDVGYL
jgi:hypothetical protein